MTRENASLSTVYRILDANSNRAAEGLRTLEEYFRFVEADASISTELKHLRHDLANVLQRLDRRSLLLHRDSIEDVGRTIKTPSEHTRAGYASILAAAAQRVQQSLRCLEEYTKMIDPVLPRQIEPLRYRAYELLARIELRTMHPFPWLERARLYVLVDCQLPIDAFAAKCAAIAEAGVDLIQIRDKRCDTRTIVEYAQRLLNRLGDAGPPVIINDRVDIAASVGLGVHLGQEDLSPSVARSLLSHRQCIGLSTHTLEQATIAFQAGADYIGCGPTFPSETKSFDRFAGLAFLNQVAASVPIPSFAIGGIKLERLDEVFATGIRRIAVSHAIWQAGDPAEAAHRFAERLAEANR